MLVNITPCRIADTRPGPLNVGPRATPLGADETYSIAAHGSNGNCVVPNGAVALATNVTAVGASQQTNPRLFPADADLPLASSLNPSPGAPPTPNALTVGLSQSGQFSIYNFAGQVHVVIDVSGCYVDHDHDDRYYTQAEVDALLAPTEVTRTLHVSALEFSPPRSGESEWSEFQSNSDDPSGRTFRPNVGNAESLWAPVQLPDRAVFTRVEFFYYDQNNNIVNDLQFRLIENTGSGTITMAQTQSVGDLPNRRSAIDETINSAMIKPSSTYYLEVRRQSWGSSLFADAQAISSVVITYQIEK
ncbi:MAG: hypothetical protein AAGF73_02410 [Actinomycetota bacterium]